MFKSTLKAILFFILFVAAAAISAYVTISFIVKSEDVVITPELKGKDVLYALETLSDLSLNTRVSDSVYSSTIPKNHVVDQDPEAGTEIKKGRDVKISVSKGPESIIMPGISGLSIRQARLILDQNDLTLNAVSEISCSRFKAGEVFSQYPPSGALVQHKQPINLLVSSGKSIHYYQMTDFTGLSEDEAIIKIEKSPFSPGNIRYISIKNMPKDLVVNQSPLPGERAAAGQKVNMVVNRSGYHVKSPFRKKEGLYRYRLENGFLKQKVRATVVTSSFSMDIYNDFLKPGQELWLFVPNNDNPTLYLYVDEKLVDRKSF